MPENLYQRGPQGTWYFAFKCNGKRFRGSCFTHRLDEAKRVMRRKMAEAEANPAALSVATTRLPTIAAMAVYDADRARLRGSSDAVIASTVARFWQRLAKVFDHAGEVTRDSLATYARRMLDEGIAPQTVKRDLWAVKRGYEWARDVDPTLPPLGKLPELARREPGKNKGVPVSLDKVREFLSALNGRARDHAIIILMTGLRLSEFQRLEDVMWFGHKRDTGGNTFDLAAEMTKNRRARSIGVSHTLRLIIERSRPYSVNNCCAWRTASRRVGLSKAIMARDLRHMYASTLAPFDPYGVDMTMGHAPGALGSSTRYYQHTDRDRLMRLAHEAERVFGFALDLAD